MTTIKLPTVLFKPRVFLKFALLLPLVATLLAGCASTNDPELYKQSEEGFEGAAKMNKGDTITVSFDGIPNPPATAEKTINEDGTISLPDIGTITVAGKTTGEIEKVITDKYVPAIYTHLTVTVKAGDRVYYVRGEVKSPGRQIYVGQITVTKAITSAGDFTDFSDKKDVVLERADGKQFHVNCDRILDGKVKDPPVFPGDQITVNRRWL